MAIIKELSVKVTYTVSYGNVKIPKKVLKQLEMATDKYHEIDMNDRRYPEAGSWLNDIIQEKDCMDWSCEVTELEV